MTKEPMMICDKAKQCRFASTGDHFCCQYGTPHTHGSSCDWNMNCGVDKETGAELIGVCLPV